jgi:hypothetical protein
MWGQPACESVYFSVVNIRNSVSSHPLDLTTAKLHLPNYHCRLSFTVAIEQSGKCPSIHITDSNQIDDDIEHTKKSPKVLA